MKPCCPVKDRIEALEEALMMIEGLYLSLCPDTNDDSPGIKAIAAAYQVAHAALRACGNPHEDWQKQSRELLQFLKDSGIINPEKQFAARDEVNPYPNVAVKENDFAVSLSGCLIDPPPELAKNELAMIWLRRALHAEMHLVWLKRLGWHPFPNKGESLNQFLENTFD